MLGGLFLLFLAICCCCAFWVFLAATQDSQLREDLQGMAGIALALRAAL